MNKEVTIDIENPKDNDLINRQAVLKQLKGCLTGGETEYQYVKLHIDSIPSVKPREPTGHWIEISRGFECDQCHGIDTDGLEPPYCKWCGTQMKGGI